MDVLRTCRFEAGGKDVFDKLRKETAELAQSATRRGAWSKWIQKIECWTNRLGWNQVLDGVVLVMGAVFVVAGVDEILEAALAQAVGESTSGAIVGPIFLTFGLLLLQIAYQGMRGVRDRRKMEQLLRKVIGNQLDGCEPKGRSGDDKRNHCEEAGEEYNDSS